MLSLRYRNIRAWAYNKIGIGQVIYFPPRPDEDDINFKINSSRNSLEHLTWADLGTILKALANERKNIQSGSFLQRGIMCTWNDIHRCYMNGRFNTRGCIIRRDELGQTFVIRLVIRL